MALESILRKNESYAVSTTNETVNFFYTVSIGLGTCSVELFNCYEHVRVFH
jgi:hypothetical protein